MNHKPFWCFQVLALYSPQSAWLENIQWSSRLNATIHKLSVLQKVRTMPVLYKLFISHINRPRGIQLETLSLWICRWMFPSIFPLAKWRGDILFVWLVEDNSFIFYEYKTWLLCGHKSNYAFKDWTFPRNVQQYCERMRALWLNFCHFLC